MLVLFEISLADCKRHLTSSVGQRTNDAKKAADEPAKAFSNELSSSIFSLNETLQIAFWHKPYDINKTAFSISIILIFYES